MRRMWDAAFSPAKPPAWEAVAGYIGGNTPHVWTAAEWAATAARFRLPIFVRSHDGDPTADATFGVAWLRQHGVPKGSTLALDYETRVDAAYLQAFDRVVIDGGWRVMVYGTRSFVLQNPRPSGGYWTAHWTNVPHLCADPGVAATQYGGDTTLGQPWDASLVADSTPLWDTQGGIVAFDDDEKRYLDWLALWIAGRANRVFSPKLLAERLGIDVEVATPATGPDIRDLAVKLQVISDKLDAGLEVGLTPEQVADLKAALPTLEGTAMVQLAVSPPA